MSRYVYNYKLFYIKDGIFIKFLSCMHAAQFFTALLLYSTEPVPEPTESPTTPPTSPTGVDNIIATPYL